MASSRGRELFEELFSKQRQEAQWLDIENQKRKEEEEKNKLIYDIIKDHLLGRSDLGEPRQSIVYTQEPQRRTPTSAVLAQEAEEYSPQQPAKSTTQQIWDIIKGTGGMLGTTALGALRDVTSIAPSLVDLAVPGDETMFPRADKYREDINKLIIKPLQRATGIDNTLNAEIADLGGTALSLVAGPELLLGKVGQGERFLRNAIENVKPNAITNIVNKYKQLSTPGKIGAGAGAAVAGATGVETIRGAAEPEYAEQKGTFLPRLGSSLRYGVGETAQMAGDIAEMTDYPHLASILQNAGQKIKKGYEPEPVEFNWKSFFDPNWYANNVAASVPMSAALIPLMYAGFKGGKAGAAKAGLSPTLQTIIGSLAGTALSRPVESAMEAASAYRQVLDEGGSHEKADAVAQKVFKQNLALGGMDALQLAITLGGGGKGGMLSKLLSSPARRVAGSAAFDIASEAAEEGIQQAIQQSAMGKDTHPMWQQILYPDTQMKESMAIGGLFGGTSGGAGSIVEEIKSRTLNKLSEKAKDDVKNILNKAVNDGINVQDAFETVLDAVAQNPEGQKVISDATQEVANEYIEKWATPALQGNILSQQDISNKQNEKDLSTGKIEASDLNSIWSYGEAQEPVRLIDNSNPHFWVIQKQDGSRIVAEPEELTKIESKPKVSQEQPAQVQVTKDQEPQTVQPKQEQIAQKGIEQQIAPATIEEPSPIEQQTDSGLNAYGLTVQKGITKNNNPVWEVSGNTKEHKEAIKKAGGKYFKPKNTWAFYQGEDPTPAILATIEGTQPDTQTETTNEAQENGTNQKNIIPESNETKTENEMKYEDQVALLEAIKKQLKDELNLERPEQSTEVTPKQPISYDRYGKMAFNKEVKAIHINEGTSAYEDFKNFFDKYYSAGRNGERMPRADIHPAQAAEFYQAGRKDYERSLQAANKTSETNPSKKEPAQKQKSASQKETTLKPANNGNRAYRKWIKNEYVNIDPNDPEDADRLASYNRFFEKWYWAGVTDTRTIDVVKNEDDTEFPPFLQDEFYKAGQKDIKIHERRGTLPEKPEKPQVGITRLTRPEPTFTGLQQQEAEEKETPSKSQEKTPESAQNQEPETNIAQETVATNEPEKAIQRPGPAVIKRYDAFNERRYSNPWVAEVTDDGKLNFKTKVGGYTGGYNKGEAGELYVSNPQEGKIYAYGQKDYRGKGGGYKYVQFKNGEFIPVEKTQLIEKLNEAKKQQGNKLPETETAKVEEKPKTDVKYTQEEPAKKEGSEGGESSQQILERGNEEGNRVLSNTGLSDRTDVNSIRSTGGESAGLFGRPAEKDTGDVSIQQSEHSATNVHSNIQKADTGQPENRGPAREAHGTEDSVQRQPRTAGERTERDTERSPGVSREEKSSPVKKVAYSNFRINEENQVFIKGGKKERYKANIEALKTLESLFEENREATIEDQRKLALFSGWGALPEVFDLVRNQKNGKLEPRDGWEKEHEETKEILNRLEKHLPQAEGLRGSLYERSKASIQNAHYTSPEIIKAMYDALLKMGFKKGNLLEPSMGTGNFFGLIPDSIAGKTKLYGVELEPATGAIAQYLYPNADIRIQGFQKTNYPDKMFDAAIGNVPFGDTPIYDDKYPGYLREQIHNYFFVKTLDKVKPGGIIAFITSTGTMDSANERVRNYLANKANLIAAIRLPGNAFKDNAGTEVTTDIIFLQKLRENEIPNGIEWVKTGKYELDDNTYNLNEYFIKNPHMIIGELVQDKLHSNRLGVVAKDKDIKESITEIIREYLPSNILNTAKTQPASTEIPPEIQEMAEELIDGGLTKKGNKIYRKIGKNMVEVKENTQQIAHLLDMRELTKELLEMQRKDDVKESELAERRTKLKSLYDSYVQKYGNLLKRDNINGALKGRPHVEKVLGYSKTVSRKTKKGEKENQKVFFIEPETYLLKGLEIETVITDAEGNSVQKFSPAQIFSQRTYTPHKPVEKVATANEGVIASLNELGYLDIEYISKIYGKGEQEIIDELGDRIYLNPTGDWETADEYLSGNVRKKLKEAKERAEHDPAFLRNVEALEKIIPADIPFEDIVLYLGDPWVPLDITESMVFKILGLNYRYDKQRIALEYSPDDNNWNLRKGKNFKTTAEMAAIESGLHMGALEIVKKALNNSNAVVTYKDEKGKEYIDKAKTDILRAKIKEIRESLKENLFQAPDAMERVAHEYNERFNCIVPRDYSKLAEVWTFPNINQEIKLRKAQTIGILRALLGGNTLLAHGVGVGKTYEEIAIAMESKRLGLANKPLLVVPNTKLTDFENDAKELYPGAKILALNENDFNKDNIKRTLAIAALNEWDMVIIRHSSFSKIPISPETEMPAFREEIQELEESLLQMRGEKRFSIKKIENRLEKLRAKLEEYQKNKINYEGLMYFENMGFDMVIVDEAHEYKNYPLGGRAATIKGLSTSNADKARDLMIKLGYVRKLNGGKRGTVFATGTPVSNTMAEIYVMFKYLRPDLLQEAGVNNFDAWANTFTEITNVTEISARGKFENKFKFKNFVNLPELITMFREFADIIFTSEIGLPLPKHEYINVECDAHPQLTALMKKINNEWDDAVKDGTVLKLFNKIRTAPQDMRLVVADSVDIPGSKVNKCVKNVMKVYKETQKEKGTQLIFMTKGESSLTGFNLWEDLRNKLIKQGIPANEIAFVKSKTPESKLQEIYRKVNAGKIRVVIGSYGKLGVGVNVQERLFAIHEIDVPYRPADIEQAEGRMIRQGNIYYDLGKTTRIYRYVTIGDKDAFSGDAFSWQIIESKRKGINALMKGDTSKRTMEAFDAEAYDAATLKAIAIGDERILRKVELEKQIDELKGARNSYLAKQAQAKRGMDYNLKQIGHLRTLTARYKDALATLESKAEHEPNVFDVNGIKYDLAKDKENANKKITQLIKNAEDAGRETDIEIGTYQGLTIRFVMEKGPSYGSMSHMYESLKLYNKWWEVAVISSHSYNTSVRKAECNYWTKQEDLDFAKNITRAIKNLKKEMDEALEKIEDLYEQNRRYEKMLEEPFKKEAELAEKEKELRELNAALGIGDVSVDVTEGSEETPQEEETEYEEESIGQMAKRSDKVVDNNQAEWNEVNLQAGSATGITQKRFTAREVKRHLRNIANEYGGKEAGYTSGHFQFRPEALKDPEFQAAVAEANAAGMIVFPYSCTNKFNDLFDGIMMPDGTMYLNVNTGNRSKLAIQRHESAHWTSRQNPEQFRAWRDIVEVNTNPETVKTFYKAIYGSRIPEAKVIDELVCDMVAQAQAGNAAEEVFAKSELKDLFGDKAEKVLAEIRTQIAGQLTPSTKIQLQAISESTPQSVSAYKIRKGPAPKNTLIGYKLMRIDKNGELYPLYVGAKDPIPQNIWLDATEGERATPSKTGIERVKSKLGDLSFRPGWHIGDIPLATHIGKKGESGKIEFQKPGTVWVEVEYAHDIDYQSQAGKNGLQMVPVDGSYRFKTNESMTGDWAISGSMKINRILSDKEAAEINEKAGFKSLPRHPNDKHPATKLGMQYKNKKPEKAPVFYSQLQRVIEEKMPNKANVAQIRGIIRSGQVKEEEIQWSGIDNWLNDLAKEGRKVSKEEVLGFLLANEIEIEEITKRKVMLDDVYDKKREIDEYIREYARGRFSGEGESDRMRLAKQELEKNQDPGYLKLNDELKELQGSNVKYEDWQLQGGKNYRELLLTWEPDYDGQYQSSHWEEPNVLAHVRFNDRIGQNGEKVLFLEEVQSDWHQAGRRMGYKNSVIPDAPFKTTWYELVLKRMLRYAAENGYNRIAWTTGEQQAKRYDLSKQIDKIEAYTTRLDGKVIAVYVSKNGRDIPSVSSTYNHEGIIQTFGKDLGTRIIKGAIEKDGRSFFVEGEDLTIGGEGMKGFYDKMIPAFLNKYVKKWGAKVEKTSIRTSSKTDQEWPTWDEYLDWDYIDKHPGVLNDFRDAWTTKKTGNVLLMIGGHSTGKEILKDFGSIFTREGKNILKNLRDASETVYSLPITESMRETVLYKGQALFKPKPAGEDTSSEYKFANPEIQQRMKDAYGLKPETIIEKLKKAKDEIFRKMTREFEHLPRNNGFYSPARNALLKIKKQHGVTSAQTIHYLREITKGLNENEYTLFSYKVIFDDLAEDLANGMELLPFGFDADSLKEEKELLDKHLEENYPNVLKAIEKRKQVWNEIKDLYIEAQESIGHHVEDRLRREFYYHHQVLEYATAKNKVFGTGSQLKTPSYRGFLQKRKGSSFDINSNYLEAEYEVMQQMLMDIEIAETIKVMKRYDVTNDLKKLAVQHNDSEMLKVFQSLADSINKGNQTLDENGKPQKEVTAEELYRKMLNKKQAIALGKLADLAARGELPLGPNDKWKWVVEKLADTVYKETALDAAERLTNIAQDIQDEKFYSQGLFPYLNWLGKAVSEVPEEATMYSKMFFSGVTKKQAIIKSTLKERYANYKDFIPEGYIEWQPRKGHIFFMANSIPEGIAEELFYGTLEQYGLHAEEIRKVLAVGKKYPAYIIPKELADQLDNLYDGLEEISALRQAYHAAFRFWKKWQLLMPRRLFKYNLRNLTGDLDAVVGFNPKALRRTDKAFRDLWEAFFTEEKHMTLMLKEFIKRGGLESLLQAQEIYKINYKRQFKQLVESKMKKTPIEKIASLPVKAWFGYWDSVRATTDFREAILRYANFIEYYEQMKLNGGVPENFGCSNREEVMALDNLFDRAYKLANELMGAYDEVSVLGQKFADSLAPFWRWNEVNFRRYIQGYKNAYIDGKTAQTIVRKTLGTAIKMPIRVSMSIAKTVIMTMLMAAVLTAWNYLRYPDEEKDLPADVKQRLHIVLGKDKNGNVIYFSRLGALQDFLDWFGLDTPVNRLQDYLSGKKSLKEVALDEIKNPLNKIVQAIGPWPKTVFEIALSKSSFPDITNSKQIYDRLDYIAQSFGLEKDFRSFTHTKLAKILGFDYRPAPKYSSTLPELFIYKSDPEQVGYYANKDAKAKFMREVLFRGSGYQSGDDPKSNALFNLKQCLRYKDSEGATEFFIQYLLYGGTIKGFKKSLQALNPLYGLSKKKEGPDNKSDMERYVESLDAEGKENLVKAYKYYFEWLAPEDTEE